MTCRWFDLTLSNKTEQSELCIPCARCKRLTVPTDTTQTRGRRWQIIPTIVLNSLQLTEVGASKPMPAGALELRGAFCHHLDFQLLQKILRSYQSSQPVQSFCLLGLGLLSSSQDTTTPGWLSQRHGLQPASPNSYSG